ncbi:MAG: hypothetical protein WBP61_14070 [Nocardioides sp.]
MIHGTAPAGRALTILAVAVLVGGCASTDGAQARSESHAQELVAATQSAGVAPGLTAQVAESLYGDSAPQICGVLDDGVSTAEQLLVSGNPAGRREKLISTDAITYEGLVVQTYCPGHSDAYDDLVADIDGTATTG